LGLWREGKYIMRFAFFIDDGLRVEPEETTSSVVAGSGAVFECLTAASAPPDTRKGSLSIHGTGGLPI